MTAANAHDKVVQMIRIRGPVIPSQVNKEIDTNILFASAILGELSCKKILKVSSVKIGGSPLYYLPGQESMLQRYADKLHPKEKEAYDILNRKKVLDDSKQVPAVRAALRGIKDFAKPLQVTHNGANHLFWKWYLLSNEEAESMIKGMLGISEPEAKKQPEERKEKASERIQEKAAERLPEREERIEKVEHKKVEQPRSEPRRIDSMRHEFRKPEVQRALKETVEKAPRRPPKEEHVPAENEPNDRFFRKAKKYFDESSIKMIDFRILKKEMEIDFTVKIPSTVGTLTYFCKARNKKKISDGDLSSVYIQAQSKKMPVLFLTPGDLTKKAKELLEKEFRNMSVKKI